MSAEAFVRCAKAQVGKSYVYGAAGPNAYDCSGLTQYAFRAAGIGLPQMPPGSFGYLYLPALVIISLASVLTAPLGARTAHRMDVRPLAAELGR